MYKRSLLILALQNQVSAFWTSSRKFYNYQTLTVGAFCVFVCRESTSKNSYQKILINCIHCFIETTHYHILC